MPELYSESKFVSEITEINILRCMEADEESCHLIMEELTGKHFFIPENAKLFRMLSVLKLKGNKLNQSSILPEISGDPVLLAKYNKYSNLEVSTADIDKYISILKSKLQYRQLRDIQKDLDNKLNLTDENGSPEQLVDYIHKRISQVGSEDSVDNQAIGDILRTTIPDINNIEPVESGMLGLTTGIEPLDKMTLGLQKGHLIFIAARPSLGKSELSLQISLLNSLIYDTPVVVFSIDTTADQIASRLICTHSEIDLQKVLLRNFTIEEKPKFVNSYNTLLDAPIYIVDDPIMTLSKVNAKINQIEYLIKRKVGLVMIDYIQLLKGSNQNKVLELEDISHGLKILAKKQDIPVLALSQLSRAIESRTNDYTDPPVMSDMRASGGLEQAADEIFALTAEPKRDAEFGHVLKRRKTILWILKQKNGPTGSIKLINECPIQKFVVDNENEFINPDDDEVTGILI